MSKPRQDDARKASRTHRQICCFLTGRSACVSTTSDHGYTWANISKLVSSLE